MHLSPHLFGRLFLEHSARNEQIYNRNRSPEGRRTRARMDVRVRQQKQRVPTRSQEDARRPRGGTAGTGLGDLAATGAGVQRPESPPLCRSSDMRSLRPAPATHPRGPHPLLLLCAPEASPPAAPASPAVRSGRAPLAPPLSRPRAPPRPPEIPRARD